MTTRTERTEQKYRERAEQIARAANAEAGRILSPLQLANAVRARQLAPSSYRQMRAALIFTMGEAAAMRPDEAPRLQSAIDLLRQPRPLPDNANAADDGRLRTSQAKQITGVERDIDRICHAVLAGTSPNADALVAYLKSGMLTGGRISEWAAAQFGPSTVPGFAWELTFENGKLGNQRGHGPTRTMRWTSLPSELVTMLGTWIDTARLAAENYDTLVDTLESLMRRATKALFPKRKRRPTLSSVRHAAAARWKAAYVAGARNSDEKVTGLATVAALMGHATDETATMHYARAETGSSNFPVPLPEPSEVARIRQTYVGPPAPRPSRETDLS
jgi:integrase